MKAVLSGLPFNLSYSWIKMIYLLWSAINLVALCWFLYVCFSVLKLIKEHLGMPALIIFLLGCLSFVKETVTSDKPQTSLSQDMVLGMQTVNEQFFYSTTLSYAIPKDSSASDIKGDVYQSGLVIGHAWNPIPPTLYFKEGKLNYTIMGTHEWKLLGLTLYSQPQRFTGLVK
jgi:hypothetical protein